MVRAVIFVSVTALLVVSSWIPESEAEDMINEHSYGEYYDASLAATVTGNASTERNVLERDRSDEVGNDYIENESQSKGSSESTTVSEKINNETENTPKSSPLTAESSHLGYRMPGLFGFNGGQPFYLEKDPITGAVNFSTTTSAVKTGGNEYLDTGGLSVKNHKISDATNTSDDYYYDDEDSDNADRKDGAFDDNGLKNHVNPYKDYPPTLNDVNIHVEDASNHKYQTNHNNKFLLISSSYANTKVQGTGSGINRNHRPYTTSSTQSPSYYTIRPQPTFLTSTPEPPSRGTITYKSSQSNNPPVHFTIEETTYYKPSTKKHDNYNSQKFNSQQNNQQVQESHEEALLDRLQLKQEYERHDEKQQQEELRKHAQDQQQNIRQSNHSSPSVTNPEASVQILPIKATQPFDYEEESNEDYDTDAPINFSSSELLGYNEPPARNEGEKPQQEQNEQEKEPVKQVEHKKTVLLTSQPTHTSTTTKPTITHQESSSEDQNYVTYKNLTQDKLHTTQKPITKKPSITYSPGIIYSEPSTVKYQNIGTSMPLDTQSHSKQQSESHRPEKYQPSLNMHSDTNRQDTSETALADLASKPTENVKTNIATVVPSVHQQGKPGYFGESSIYLNVAASGQFGSNTVKSSPYGSYAEEPFRPIFGPGQVDDRPPLRYPEHQPLVAPPNKDRNTNSVSNSNLSQIEAEDVGLSKIPKETPSRWNYPYNEGASTFFQLPPSHSQRQQQQQKQNIVPAGNPPRIPGVEPPKPHSQDLPFVNVHSQHQKPSYTSETSVPMGSFVLNHSGVQSNDLQRPADSQTQVIFPLEWDESNSKRKGDGEGNVIFPNSRPEGAKPQDEKDGTLTRPSIVSTNKEPIVNEEDNYQPSQSQSRPQQEEVGSFEITHTSNQLLFPLPSHPGPLPKIENGSPVSYRDIIKEPAQELRPPAEPENLRQHSVSGSYPRPQWESRLTAQSQYLPQPETSQIAKPKHDAMPPYFGQNSPTITSGYRIHPGFSPEHPFQGKRPQPVPKNRNQDPSLPNILPQFRPNAKITHVHPEGAGRIQAYPHFGPQRQPLLERPNRRPPPEFMGHLHPPPPPHHHRRVNRNDSPGPLDGLNKGEGIFPFEKYPLQPPTTAQQRPLVHRRTGPHITDAGGSEPQVATLQMMQHQQQGASTHFRPRPQAARDDFPDSNVEMKPPFKVKYPLGSALDVEASEKQPVFVVYPVNSTPLNIGGGNSNNGGVVVGTRGPQRPLPPSNLDSESGLLLSSEDINGDPLNPTFPGHNKNQKPVLQLPKDRLDSPQLQSQNPTNTATPNINVEQPIKSDFPYSLERPDIFRDIEEDEIKQDNEGHKETSILGSVTLRNNDRYDDEFPITHDGIQAEVHDSNNDRHNEDDTEINIIPYLQDYMPFATKKPITSIKLSSEKNSATLASISVPLGFFTSSIKPERDVFHGNQWTTVSGGHQTQDSRVVKTGSSGNEVYTSTSSTSEPYHSSAQTVQPQSSTTHSPVSQAALSVTGYPKSSTLSVYGVSPQSGHQQGLVGSAGSEFTVSAVMHTHPQALSNHRPAEPFSSTPPPQLNFQAPFLASANIGAAPTNQGWSVVGSGEPNNERMKPGTVDKADLHEEELEASDIKTGSEDLSSEPNNFDFENFRPQLFGGFKPIYTFPEENGETRSKYLQITDERQEKMISV
jgi:hypothetical protein